MDHAITAALPFAPLAARSVAGGDVDCLVETAVFEQLVMGLLEDPAHKSAEQMDVAPLKMPSPPTVDSFAFITPPPDSLLSLLPAAEPYMVPVAWPETLRPSPTQRDAAAAPIYSHTLAAEDVISNESHPMPQSAGVSMQELPLDVGQPAPVPLPRLSENATSDPEPVQKEGDKHPTIEASSKSPVERPSEPSAIPIVPALAETCQRVETCASADLLLGSPFPKAPPPAPEPARPVKAAGVIMGNPSPPQADAEPVQRPLASYFTKAEKDLGPNLQPPPPERTLYATPTSVASQTAISPIEKRANRVLPTAAKPADLQANLDQKPVMAEISVPDSSAPIRLHWQSETPLSKENLSTKIEPAVMWENPARVAIPSVPAPLSDDLPVPISADPEPVASARSVSLPPRDRKTASPQVETTQPPPLVSISFAQMKTGAPQPTLILGDRESAVQMPDPARTDLKPPQEEPVVSLKEATFHLRLDLPKSAEVAEIVPRLSKGLPVVSPKAAIKEELLLNTPQPDRPEHQSNVATPDQPTPLPNPDPILLAIEPRDSSKPLHITQPSQSLSPQTSAPNPAHQAAAALVQNLTPETNRIELTLTPEDLGSLRFEIHRHGDELSIVLSAERPETLDLMRRHLPDLAAELKQAGLQGGTLSFGQWADRGQERAQNAFELRTEAEAPMPSLPPSPKQPRSNQGLDLRL